MPSNCLVTTARFRRHFQPLDVRVAAANDRLALGMSVLHAALNAARRRAEPTLFISLTTDRLTPQKKT